MIQLWEELKHFATFQSDESPSPQPKARFHSLCSHTSRHKSLFLFQSRSKWEWNISCYYRLPLVQTELPPRWQTNQHGPELIRSVLSTCSRVWLSEGVIFSLPCQNKAETLESDDSQITLRTTQRRRVSGDFESVKVVLPYRDGHCLIPFMVGFLFFVFSLAGVTGGKRCDLGSVTRHRQSSPSIVCVNVNKH